MTTIMNKERAGILQEKNQALPAQETGQYSLWQILGIWAIAALPMGLLTWVVAPIVIPYIPLHPGITYWLMMIAGMAWQFVVSVVILYRELGTLRWSAIRQRIWLQTPREPGTDKPNAKLFWWVLPPLFIEALAGLLLIGFLDAPMAWLFPALKAPGFADSSKLTSLNIVGQWWPLGIALVSYIFNYFLGEGLLWHGVLLPKMQGVFGKYDWVANAVIFGLYHLHKPWAFVSVITTNLTISWPTRRFRSYWMAIIVHGADGLFTPVIIMAMVLGLFH